MDVVSRLEQLVAGLADARDGVSPEFAGLLSDLEEELQEVLEEVQAEMRGAPELEDWEWDDRRERRAAEAARP